jgi:hypothetical protein
MEWFLENGQYGKKLRSIIAQPLNEFAGDFSGILSNEAPLRVREVLLANYHPRVCCPEVFSLLSYSPVPLPGMQIGGPTQSKFINLLPPAPERGCLDTIVVRSYGCIVQISLEPIQGLIIFARPQKPTQTVMLQLGQRRS